MLCHPKWERERDGEKPRSHNSEETSSGGRKEKKKKGRRQAASIEASKQMLSSALRARGPLCF